MKFNVGDRVKFEWRGDGLYKGDYIVGEGVVLTVRDDYYYEYEVEPDWDRTDYKDSFGWMPYSLLFAASELDYVDDSDDEIDEAWEYEEDNDDE